MSDNSMDVYIRSLVVEAINLESPDISIKSADGKISIEFLNQGEWLPYPHAPKPEYGDLLARLKEMAGVGGEEGTGSSSVIRRGSETIPLEISVGPGETKVHIQTN